ncbi:hypothetical protein PPERSA_02058 [Pseudocohnilembus persalinus]|uniref:Pop1 N-terminal domain-containing protein n=1 Tax=Pseudocohnilembus persalinus TaxID=266149 RepID=A0A0V0QF91_PSEPJ|nr:hypothetical protein PPERSA_02058 [Pseudocohnilembus persalinus]|eukprot:KRX00879.1 hypothetical protein PPERSA_02058 [Pseudocohnilembus persalinus]
MEERTIDIEKFIQARSQEIYHFTKQIEQKKIFQSKQPYQSVPKHLRRRAMSHNRYRIPLRIRAKMSEKELDQQEMGQDPISCRKNIRKPKLLMAAYKRRAQQSQWLETHLWHAKRMKMER